ncbi:MAG: T9SS type A sorting domain-containing protein [Clostridia bacterium]|nr:T9SS type A sorting domain-containing protein [Clostridia bacterium]
MAYVSFNEGRGLNKIAHRNAEIPMVYVPVDGINYAVATMNQDVTEIPVSFKAATIGEYTIGAETQNCEYAMITLVDRFTGIETNLLLEDYTFIAKSNDSAERFIIKLAMDNSNGDVNENFAFINNGMMYIYNIEGQGTVSVYDVTGRPVAEYNVATSANISTSDFAAGMYIIRMSDENGVKTQKIVVE